MFYNRSLILIIMLLSLTILISTITKFYNISSYCMTPYIDMGKKNEHKDSIKKDSHELKNRTVLKTKNKHNMIDEIPITINPPVYECNSLKGATSEKCKFLIAHDLLKMFNQNKDKALEHLYKEMGEMRKYIQSSIESALTFEQILFTVDASIRCNLHFYPFNSFQQYHIIRAYDEINALKSKYKVVEYTPEVFYHHHRLRFARQEIKDYIRQRDIIDMGAYCGDSMIILTQYTDKTVYSYEYSIHNVEKIKKSIIDNNISANKVMIINKGIADEVKTVESQSTTWSNSQIIEGSKGSKINLTTIDFEAKDLNLHIGLIKSDIEGYEYKALKGAMNVIREQRPVISISLYHNTESFFGTPKLLSELENYQFEMLSGTFENDITLLECTYFAYPKEILKD